MSSENIDTRTRILEATVQTLVESGGHGVRMGDIAKETGISRQAVYLHFASRTDLLVAATRYLDEVLDVDRRLAPSRAAKTGVERLQLYIECWGNYIPEIYGVAKALMMARDTDEAAAAAWKDRMLAMRDGCRAAICRWSAGGWLDKAEGNRCIVDAAAGADLGKPHDRMRVVDTEVCTLHVRPRTPDVRADRNHLIQRYTSM